LGKAIDIESLLGMNCVVLIQKGHFQMTAKQEGKGTKMSDDPLPPSLPLICTSPSPFPSLSPQFQTLNCHVLANKDPLIIQAFSPVIGDPQEKR
jgi:hypothetical protein